MIKACLTDSQTDTLSALFPQASHVHQHDACPACERVLSWIRVRSRIEVMCGGAHPLRAGAWIANTFAWGVTIWPVSWCNLQSSREVDCGVFADAYSRALTAVMVPHNRAQVLLPASNPEHAIWSAQWDRGRGPRDWLLERACYHECVYLHEGPDGGYLFDSTEMIPLSPDACDPRRRALAVRILNEGFEPMAAFVRVDSRTVPVGKWTLLQAGRDFSSPSRRLLEP